MGIFDKKEEEAKGAKEVEAAEEARTVTADTSKKEVKEAKTEKVEREEIVMQLTPIITEKAHALAQAGKYVFRVARKSTKKGIAREVHKQHSVDVVSVNVVNQPRKRRSVGRNRGYQQSYKKAIVTVKKGQHIAAFETV